ncbi:MAG: nucleotide exchange factor GrpE [Eggerthellaceae bacterium]|nr:nucleotide exchange factor GrpE [Eggerthellaceae bacterium]
MAWSNEDTVTKNSQPLKADASNLTDEAADIKDSCATGESIDSPVSENLTSEEGFANNKATMPTTDAVEVEPSSEEMVLQAQAEMQEWKDKFMRLHAEWDTYRRRISEQRASERASATEKLVEHLLPVIDDFERTIDYAEKNGEAGLLGGIQAVQGKLIDALEKEGVEIINPKGEAFHALECQAVATHEDKSVPDETVVEVFQKGYKMGNKVLRCAMVNVATGGSKRKAPKDSSE